MNSPWRRSCSKVCSQACYKNTEGKNNCAVREQGPSSSKWVSQFALALKYHKQRPTLFLLGCWSELSLLPWGSVGASLSLDNSWLFLWSFFVHERSVSTKYQYHFDYEQHIMVKMFPVEKKGVAFFGRRLEGFLQGICKELAPLLLWTCCSSG